MLSSIPVFACRHEESLSSRGTCTTGSPGPAPGGAGQKCARQTGAAGRRVLVRTRRLATAFPALIASSADAQNRILISSAVESVVNL
jgi:hypothetical protein